MVEKREIFEVTQIFEQIRVCTMDVMYAANDRQQKKKVLSFAEKQMKLQDTELVHEFQNYLRTIMSSLKSAINE